MKFVSIIESNPPAELRELPVLALDLGFTGKTETCGVATSPSDDLVRGCSTYGELLKDVSSWIARHPPRVVLIVEAPLSGGFDASGHPIPRGDFERVHSETGASSPRHWNVMAGASMALAAIHFCKSLLSRVPSDVTVHLIEGFASRYAEPKPDHRDVAIALLNQWQRGGPLLTSDTAVTLISVPEILDAALSNAAPAILRVPDGLLGTASS